MHKLSPTIHYPHSQILHSHSWPRIVTVELDQHDIVHAVNRSVLTRLIITEEHRVPSCWCGSSCL